MPHEGLLHDARESTRSADRSTGDLAVPVEAASDPGRAWSRWVDAGFPRKARGALLEPAGRAGWLQGAGRSAGPDAGARRGGLRWPGRPGSSACGANQACGAAAATTPPEEADLGTPRELCRAGLRREPLGTAGPGGLSSQTRCLTPPVTDPNPLLTPPVTPQSVPRRLVPGVQTGGRCGSGPKSVPGRELRTHRLQVCPFRESEGSTAGMPCAGADPWGPFPSSVQVPGAASKTSCSIVLGPDGPPSCSEVF